MVSSTAELSNVSPEHVTCRTVGSFSKRDVFSPDKGKREGMSVRDEKSNFYHVYHVQQD